MINRFHVATAAALLFAAPAAAQTVLDTEVRTVAGGTSTTTTDATGTRSTVTGARQSGAPGPGFYQANLGGGATVGVTTDYARNGNGSAFFDTTGGAAKADIQYLSAAPVALSSITSLSYDYFRASSSTTNAGFAPVVRLDILKNGAFAGALVLENLYQTRADATVDSWTNVSATQNSGIFWATNARLGPTFAAANGGQKTLAEWISDNSDGVLTTYGFTAGVGSGWNGRFTGAVDDVRFGVDGQEAAAFNFEVASAAAVPEPASWAMMIVGMGAIGGSLRRRAKTAIRLALA